MYTHTLKVNAAPPIEPLQNIVVREDTRGDNWLVVTVSNEHWREVVNDLSEAPWILCRSSAGNSDIIYNGTNEGMLQVSDCYDIEDVILIFKQLEEVNRSVPKEKPILIGA